MPATRPSDAPRYDAETLRQALALASTLQHQQPAVYSARDIETAGAEVGLEPAVIREALQVLTHPAAPRADRARRKEFFSLLAALAVGPVSGMTAYALWCAAQGSSYWVGVLMAPATLIAPVLLSVAQGFVAGRKAAGFTAGVWLALCLAPSFWWWVYSAGAFEVASWCAAILYLLLGGSLAGSLGVLGAAARAHYFPAPEPAPLQHLPAADEHAAGSLG